MQPTTIAAADEPDRGVRGALKSATRAAHDRVDQAFGAFDLADAADYRDFLAAHHAVIPGVERSLTMSRVGRVLPDWNDRRRGEALAADLDDLGLPRAAPDGPIVVVEPARALGWLYVLEGSRLGASVLAGRLLANPDEQCRRASRYLRHGRGGGLWPSFLSVLEASKLSHVEFDAALAGALELFALFEAAAVAALRNSAAHPDQ
ncbi:biliverdin-producing heme oxygenase [Sphingomonas sp. BN140010]|uniref:Biliverdin-producing heme oxygenase n=1 Tax=Sphingomonas arvum TaxID=2992113 RepID=A0ABT3JC94_9SPHN|nr:biliverdin-producing heme oxygenase [Sphingomonas sp. BN140010]MCW3796689.1 biliverdin-producing heme oxygenase [Sphingomonas sp. BN140010]